jgi:threonine dehydrogenase-like Zn-dependent dehydrogenase
MECRAAVVTAFESPTEIWNVPIPELEPSGVLVKVEAATLCGTDAHRWSKDIPVQLPFVPGHETCGTIVDSNGPVVDILGAPLKAGDRIISTYINCGHCYWCQVSRQTSLCVEVNHFGGWHPNRLLGGCAQYHYFPPRSSLIRVPDEVSSPLAASAACALRTVVHGFEHVGPIHNHETVAVQGAGPLGLYASALAKDHGAKQVLLIGAPAGRLAVASDFGADAVLDLDVVKDPKERIAWVHDHTGGRGADAVVNCANAYAFVEGLDLARRGGRVVSIGVGGTPSIQVTQALLWKQLHINTVVMAEPRHFLQALEFLASRRKHFPFEKMLSRVFKLEDTGEALREMNELREIKPVIYPNAQN